MGTKNRDYSIFQKMNFAYVLKPLSPLIDWSRRTGPFHEIVFHGAGYYVTYQQNWDLYAEGKWNFPAVTNNIREPLHVIRSGRFLPSVCMPDGTDIAVNEKVKNELAAEFPQMKFLEVVFEKIVDIKLPAIGDFSWFEHAPFEKYPDARDFLNALYKESAELRRKVGKYYTILPANFKEVRSKYKTKKYPYLFGTYYGYSWETEYIELSRKMLDDYLVIRYPIPVVVHERVFSVLAPYIDLDYFEIAIARME